MFRAVFPLLLLSLFSCQKERAPSGDPKKVLADYISKSFAVNRVGDREELLELLTGEAHRRLKSMSEPSFKKTFVDRKREFIKLSYRETNPISEDRVNITYELTFFSYGKDFKAKITNKKLGSIVRTSDRWLIETVKNVRELIEYKEAMTLP